MTDSEAKYCPLCINDLTETEQNFYPCPCGYQICAFCFQRIHEGNDLCPSCRRPYDPDASTRVGPQYALKPRSETAAVFYKDPRVVQISNLPEDLSRSFGSLRQNSMLGQYGVIKKMTQSAPSSKLILPGGTKSIFVKFSKKEEADCCVLALDGATFD